MFKLRYSFIRYNICFWRDNNLKIGRYVTNLIKSSESTTSFTETYRITNVSGFVATLLVDLEMLNPIIIFLAQFTLFFYATFFQTKSLTIITDQNAKLSFLVIAQL